MIHKIRIENYKSIASLEMEFGRVNLLIGANGCGKTNLLEAVAVSGAAIFKKTDKEFLAKRGIRFVELDLMKSGFHNNNEPPITIEFLDNEDFLKIRVGLLRPRVIDFGTDGPEISHKFGASTQVSTNLTGIAYLTVINDKVDLKTQGEQKIIQIDPIEIEKQERIITAHYPIDNFLIYSPENYFLRRFEEETQVSPLGIRGEGLFSHLADLYRNQPQTFAEIVATVQELTDWVDGIEIPNDLILGERRLSIKDRYLEDGLAFIDQRSSNEGFLYLLFYATLFISPATPKFFAIDNVDNALNPKLCRKLVEVLTKLAQKHGKQVIMTAHNPGILDGLNLNDPDQRLFVLSRNADGHTKALRIAQKPSSNGSSGLKLSEQFLRGLLGGLPDNF